MATGKTSGLKWDRLARWALLAVLVTIVYSYIGPAHSWLTTYQEAKRRDSQVAALQARNAQLAKRHRDLQRAATLEREARLLGMVKAGERAYVVQGLPPERP